ncbi:hypothetical protein Bca52824_094165 [Brassica carinata]|uniref:Crossover junction endonuclease MUS81 n=1 Tax=Brassica carinata TaxID=52824 RepID=A0A8X7P3R7_BRACI|nr:hypothetical protein Bca52824_094165 [Brassica carinata]
MASVDETTTKKKLQTSYFDVVGICCSSEVSIVGDILRPLDGVKEFSVIVPSRTVIVVHDVLLISPLKIVKALNQARLEASVRPYGETSLTSQRPSPFAVVSGVLLVLSFLKYFYSPLEWFALVAVVAGVFPILAKAVASVTRFRVDINALTLIAVIATVCMEDYTEAATIVFLFSVADWLESSAAHKASTVMSSLMSLAPRKAVIAETGQEVDVDEVGINTVVSVKAGESIPIDGVVVDGSCDVDEKTLTGESFPVSKQRDSTVLAATINLNGFIKVKTTALARDCVVAKMTKLVEEAQKSQTKTQRFIDKCSRYYTPAVVVVAACFAVIPVLLKVQNTSHWFHLALVVLVSGCPCGLILSTPVATFCALTKAATSGFLIKTGDCLETLAKIRIAAFDKTGTITKAEFTVSDFKSLSRNINLKTLLYWHILQQDLQEHKLVKLTSYPMMKWILHSHMPFKIQGRFFSRTFWSTNLYGGIDLEESRVKKFRSCSDGYTLTPRPSSSSHALKACSSSLASGGTINAPRLPPLTFEEKFEEVYQVIMILDDSRTPVSYSRDPGKKIENISSRYEIKIEVRRLPVGDSIWIARHKYLGTEYVLDFIVERKTVDDMRSSIKDGRYRDQKLRLQRSGLKKLMYILEGDPNQSEAAESIKTA